LVRHGSARSPTRPRILGDAFSETRIGLDHLEFFVPTRGDLEDWASRLDSLGVAHSGVKTPTESKNAMVTFRDPDNIQLEVFFDGAGQTSAGVLEAGGDPVDAEQ
jgi:catechol 2,3-dioxygenase-like lactoylglutathione lyase family enzyme